MPERIAEEGWGSEYGHIERYRWAKKFIRPGDTVLDIACGIGYGAELLQESDCVYLGVDKPGVASASFQRPAVTFLEADIDAWEPDFPFHVAICFETLEHVADPARLAALLCRAERFVLVSVPIVPTVGINPWHQHDFTEETLLELFPTVSIAESWPQPSERSFVWAFET